MLACMITNTNEDDIAKGICIKYVIDIIYDIMSITDMILIVCYWYHINWFVNDGIKYVSDMILNIFLLNMLSDKWYSQIYF